MKQRMIALAFILSFAAAGAKSRAAEPDNSAAFARIRAEATDHSQLTHTLHMITDLYGQRLTGSPNHEAAASWAVKQLTAWGLKNAHLEAWDFGHPGWANISADAYMTAPVRWKLDLRVAAWTPSTNGTVRASVVQLLLPTPLTTDTLNQFYGANESKVRGKIVMIGKAASPLYIPTKANPAPNLGLSTRGFTAGARGGLGAGVIPAAQAETMLDAWLTKSGALGRLKDGQGADGSMSEAHNRSYDETKGVPELIIRNDDYARMERILADGDEVKVEMNVMNQWFSEGKTSHNVVAEIPGSDKADEVVMLGGHFDSWQMATGATDNGIGSTMMMEAARIIQQSGLKPRRTIRLALWSGEEEGLLGSKAYVAQHFGTIENPKPEAAKFVTYFNIDAGGGNVRAISVFGPPEAAAALAATVKAVGDLGTTGSLPSANRSEGATDTGSFALAGFSATSMMQFQSDYGTTHHTSLDTYEHVAPAEVIKAAQVIACAVWDVANRDEMLPHFTKDNVPAPTGTGGAAAGGGRRGGRRGGAGRGAQ